MTTHAAVQPGDAVCDYTRPHGSRGSHTGRTASSSALFRSPAIPVSPEKGATFASSPPTFTAAAVAAATAPQPATATTDGGGGSTVAALAPQSRGTRPSLPPPPRPLS